VRARIWASGWTREPRWCATLALIAEVQSRRTTAAHQVTENLLRMLGLTADDARAICRAPLPEVAKLIEQIRPDLPLLAAP
jgi:hypothetical protein